MKKRTERWMNRTLVAVLGFNVIGAVWWVAYRPGETDLFAKGELSLQTTPQPGTSLPHAHATLVGTSVHISGRLHRDDHGNSERRGTMEVSLIARDGRTLEIASAEYQLSPQLPKGGGYFSVTLPFRSQEASTVRIQWGEAPR